jgi:hypothetical protein
MKLYMTDFDVKKVLKILKKNRTIQKKLHCTENITETFYSEQGIYQVTNKDIFKLNVITESSQRTIYENVHWILDETCLSREKVYQMPVEHVKITLMQHIFSQSPESKVSFVVEILLKDEMCLKNDGETLLKEEIPLNIVDFYFDVSVKHSNDIPWQEINEFLLLWK